MQRQRQHRHRRRPGLQRHRDHQHHRRQRRAGGDHHAGELQRHRAGRPRPQEQRAVDRRRRCRLRLDDASRWSVTEGTLTVDRRQQRCGRRGLAAPSSVTITGTVAQIERPAEHQRHEHGQLRRQHQYAERDVNPDPHGPRQRQHRHRRRSGLQRYRDDQHHRRQRRAGGDDHADELCGDRADGAHAQEHRPVDISDVDAGSGSMTVTLAVAEGTLTVTAGTSGAVRHQLRHLVGHHHRHRGADQRPVEHQRHQHGELRRQHRYPERQRNADADHARQRQHRHRRQSWSPATPRRSTSPPSTTRRWRRSRRRAMRRPSRRRSR